MTQPPVNTSLRSAAALRTRVRELEHDVLMAHVEAERAREGEQLARKAAGDAWSLLRSLRGVPYRG